MAGAGGRSWSRWARWRRWAKERVDHARPGARVAVGVRRSRPIAAGPSQSGGECVRCRGRCRRPAAEGDPAHAHAWRKVCAMDVADTGPGIAPEKLESIFQPFVTTKPSGMGMGLSVSHSIVGAHEGRLRAENDPERGAIFHVVLPAVPAEAGFS